MGKRGNRDNYLICFLLLAATLIVYWQVRSFGFVLMDDGSYVQNNHHVLEGISLSSLVWAFTTHFQSNWHPLTWISLIVDAQIGNGNPGIFHTTNVALHLFNTLLLFILLNRITGFRWRSAAVAALFAIHPIHVESVAWVAERKDVLSTCFWLLTMLAYVQYAKQPTLRRYLLVVIAFALGLMAKPMLVSLPIILLLMDYWPLCRVKEKSTYSEQCRQWWPLVREKIPLFAMAAASCVVTYWAQATGGSVGDYDVYPIGVRVANALVACVSYIIKMICPLNLSVLYPHPENTLPVWQVVGAGVILAAITYAAIKSARSRPFIIIGWLWYLVTLVPVIGLVQVGQQAMADRYTYVPLIGLFIILAWGIPYLMVEMNKAHGEKVSFAWLILGGVLFVGLAACAYFQVGYWRDSSTLYEHAIAVDNRNYLAHLGRAETFSAKGMYSEAIEDYIIALKLAPNSAQTHYNFGVMLEKINKLPQAAMEFSYALRFMPDNPDVNNNLGAVFLRMGRLDDAIRRFNKALEAGYENTSPHINLGCAYAQKGDIESAVREFETVLRLDPENSSAREYLAMAKAMRAHRLHR